MSFLGGLIPPIRRRVAAGWRRAARTSALYLAYFLVLTAVALEKPEPWNGYAGVSGAAPLSISSTAEDLVRAIQSDPGYFAQGAIDIYEDGWFRPADTWILNLWPPGFPLIGAAILKVFSPHAPYVLVLALLDCAAWAAAFMAMQRVFRLKLAPAAASMLPLALLFFGVFRNFYLGLGLIFTENLATSLWVVSACLALLSAHRGRIGPAVGSGLALAAAAYVRTTAMFIGSALTGIAVAWAIVALLTGRRRLAVTAAHGLKSLLIVVAAYQALTLPYRLYTYERTGSTDWSNAHYLWAQQWMTGAYLDKAGAGFVREGGGGMACLLDAERCAEIAARELAKPAPYAGSWDTFFVYRDQAVATFLAHPFEWARRKLVVGVRYWFAAPTNAIHKPDPGGPEYLQNTIFALALVLGAVAMWAEPVLAAFGLALILGYLPSYLFLHLEVRYFFPFKIGLFVLAELIAAGRIARRAAGKRTAEHGCSP